MEEALDKLLGTIHAELRAIRPDALIEFRQFYCGPAPRRHCNILRAQDCPGDGFQNRMRTVDLRLTCATTAVHADMIPWHPAEHPAVILRQLLNTLFSVPQISVRLTEMPEKSRRAVADYLGFTARYRELLLKGRLAAPHPEQCYPVVSSTLGGEMLIAAYAENRLLEPPEGVRKKIMPMSVVMDERIATGIEYSRFFAELFRNLKHPESLEEPFNSVLAEKAAVK